MRNLYIALLGAGTVMVAGCSVEADPSCNGGKCDGAGDFASQLDGRNDPIAKFLREAGASQDGVVKADYGAIAKGVAAAQGCTEDSWKTFVVSDALVEGTAFPRLISTVCSTDATKASEFFIAASFKDPDEEDIDPRNLEMFAWDAAVGTYRFYAAVAEGKDSILVEVEPTKCQGCHLTPEDLAPDGMRMTPIMNELSQPWSHWNSQVPMFNASLNPFPSHEFEVPESARAGDDFIRYGRDRVGSASEFEQIIRAGHSRVAGERVKERRGTATDWKPAMNMLRPLFCEEQVQYATEDFDSGLINVTAFIPGGVRESYRAIRADNWSWDWVNNQDSRIRLQPPASREALIMVPIRGNVDVDYENRMLGARALTPMQVLRVRALDWKRPVFSDLRCNLWKDAAARFAKNPPALNLSGRILEHLKVLYDLTMTVDGTLLTTGSETTFIALDLADAGSADDLVAAVKNGTLTAGCGAGTPCAMDVDSFGAMLDGYVKSFQDMAPDAARQAIAKMRDERLCHIKANFPNAPHLPEVSCN